MALTYPLAVGDFWNLLDIEELTFSPAFYQSSAMTGDGGFLVSEQSYPKWRASVRLSPSFWQDTVYAEAILGRVFGSRKSFWAYTPSRPYPKNDPTGSTMGASTPTVYQLNGSDASQIKLDNLPASYQLNIGDFFSIPTRYSLHRIIEAVNADGSGVTTSYLTVEPTIRSSVAVDDVVSFLKPAGLFKITPGSITPQARRAAHAEGLGFEMIQVFQP